jgi:hypothetical protein
MKQLLTTIALLFAAMTAQAQDPNFYIYLAIGQSNMVGQAPPATSSPQKAVHRPTTTCIKSEKPIKKLDVVSYSGQTIHTFTPAKADITSYFYPLKGISDKVLIVVIEAQDGSKATKKCVF